MGKNDTSWIPKLSEKGYNFAYVFAGIAILAGILALVLFLPTITGVFDDSTEQTVSAANQRQFKKKTAPLRVVIDGVTYEKVSDSDAYAAKMQILDTKGNEVTPTEAPTGKPSSGSLDASSLTILINGVTYRPVSESTSDSGTDKDKPDNKPKKKKTTNNKYIVTDIDGNMVYLVKDGDTLSDVSRKVSYSVDELAKYNKIKDVNLIYTGEALRIPE